MAISVGEVEATLRLRDEMTTALQRVQSQLQATGTNLKKIGQDMRDVGMSLTAGITLPIAAIGTQALKTFAQFESQMNFVRAVSGATGDSFDKLKAQAMKLGAETVYTAQQAAEGMQFLAMAGFKTNQILGAMPYTLQLAASAQMDLGTAADIVTNILTGYSMEVHELGRANDVLVKAFTSSNTNLQQLGVAFKYAGPVANSAGMSFEMAAAALGLMGNAGIQASMAGTSLRGAITRLVNPTDKAAALMEELGIKVVDATGRLIPFDQVVEQLAPHAENTAAFMEIFGQRAGPAMAALVGMGTQALRDMHEQLAGVREGLAGDVATVQMEGLKGAWIAMTSAVEGLAIKLGEYFAPAATVVVNVVTKMAQVAQNTLIPAFAALPMPIQVAATGLLGLAVVVGPLILTAGLLATALGTLAESAFVLSVFGKVGTYFTTAAHASGLLTASVYAQAVAHRANTVATAASSQATVFWTGAATTASGVLRGLTAYVGGLTIVQGASLAATNALAVAKGVLATAYAYVSTSATMFAARVGAGAAAMAASSAAAAVARGAMIALGTAVNVAQAAFLPLAAAIAAVWVAWKVGNIESVKNAIAEWTLRLQGMNAEQAKAAVAATAAAEAARNQAGATTEQKSALQMLEEQIKAAGPQMENLSKVAQKLKDEGGLSASAVHRIATAAIALREEGVELSPVLKSVVARFEELNGSAKKEPFVPLSQQLKQAKKELASFTDAQKEEIRAGIEMNRNSEEIVESLKKLFPGFKGTAVAVEMYADHLKEAQKRQDAAKKSMEKLNEEIRDLNNRTVAWEEVIGRVETDLGHYAMALRATRDEVSKLTAVQRSEIMAGVEMGRSHAEIARVMRISEEAVRLFADQTKDLNKGIEDLNKNTHTWEDVMGKISTVAGPLPMVLQATRNEVARLTGSQRDAIVAGKELGLSTKEIATELRISEEAVEMFADTLKDKGAANLRELASAFADLAELAGEGGIGKMLQAVGELVTAMSVAAEGGEALGKALSNVFKTNGSVMSNLPSMITGFASMASAFVQVTRTTNQAQAAMGGFMTASQGTFSALKAMGMTAGTAGMYATGVGIGAALVAWGISMGNARKQARELAMAMSAAFWQVQRQMADLVGDHGDLVAAMRAVGMEYDSIFDGNPALNTQENLDNIKRIAGELAERLREVNDEFAPLLQSANDLGRVLPPALLETLQHLKDIGVLTGENAELIDILAGRTETDWRKMQDAAERYGISIDSLGDRFQQQRLGEMAQSLWDDYQMLIEGGADVGAVLAGMGDEISELVQQSIKFGTAIPENFRPLVEELLRTGQLVDENGQALTDLSQVKFGPPIESAFDKLIKKIEELIDALTGGDGVTAGLDEAARNARVAGGTMVDEFGRAEDAAHDLGDAIDRAVEMRSPTGLEGMAVYAGYAGDALVDMARTGERALGGLSASVDGIAGGLSDLAKNSSVGRGLRDVIGDMRKLDMDDFGGLLNSLDGMGSKLHERLLPLNRQVLAGREKGFSKELLEMQFQMQDEIAGLGPDPSVYRHNWELARTTLQQQLGYMLEDLDMARQAQIEGLGPIPSVYEEQYGKAADKAKKSFDKNTKSANAWLTREMANLDDVAKEYGGSYELAKRAVTGEHADMLAEAQERYDEEMARLGPVPSEYARLYGEATTYIEQYYARMKQRAQEKADTELELLGPIPDEYDRLYSEALDLVKEKYKQMVEAAAKSAKETVDAWKIVEEMFRRVAGGNPNILPGSQQVAIADAVQQVHDLFKSAGFAGASADQLAHLSNFIGYKGEATISMVALRRALDEARGKYLSGVPGFRDGTDGYVNFGSGTLAWLHGEEKVTPKGADDGDVHDADLYAEMRGLRADMARNNRRLEDALFRAQRDASQQRVR